MTDLEKFKELFNNIGIEFNVCETTRFYTKENIVEITPNVKHVYSPYGNEVHITFNSDGSFKDFQGYGDL